MHTDICVIMNQSLLLHYVDNLLLYVFIWSFDSGIVF